MESLGSEACFMDDLLDFSSDIGEGEEDDGIMKTTNKRKRPINALSSLNHHSSAPFPPFPELAEEELEWLSNKDAFPTVETSGDILSNPAPKHQSPVSVLENSNSSSTSTSTNCSTITVTNDRGSNSNTIINWGGSLCPHVVPAARRARSKRRRTRRRDLHSHEAWWVVVKNVKQVSKLSIGRKCQHCGSEKTPQWRAGPLGPKTLCNACGVRYKSGRLVPEYRPASSPTFSSELHSNSHRKVMEMRRQKQMMGMEMGMAMVKPVDKW